MATDAAWTGAEVALVALVALVVVALTASALTSVAVVGMRANHGGWELLGELAVVSVLVPVGLVYTATLLPPELFEFLR